MLNHIEAILSPEDHRHFVEYGFVVLPNILSEDEIKEVLPAPTITDDLSLDQIQIDALTSSRLITAIEELFGSGAGVVQKGGSRDMERVFEPHADWGSFSAHVDDAYPTIMPNGWAVGCFLFLTPVRSGGGAFIYFPGSSWRYRQLMERNWQVVKEAASAPEHSGAGKECLVSSGDAILFHHLMGHCGSPNVSDPEVTRHAILTRWRPRERVVPGMKPFSDMSTIEKANSARYAAHRKQVSRSTATDNSDKSVTVLRDGFSGLEKPASMAVLHHDGGIHLLYADSVRKNGVIHHMVSTDFVSWERRDDLAVSVDDVHTLQLHQYGYDVILAITTASGCAVLFSSQNWTDWKVLDKIDDCLTATPWYTYDKYPSEVAKEHTLFTVMRDDPDKVHCRSGEDWCQMSTWLTDGISIRAADGKRITDVAVAAQYSDRDCAFVVDLCGDVKKGATHPSYALTTETAASGGLLQSLPFFGNIHPWCIRILHRAQNYWMVGFLHRGQKEDRLMWGAIDWLHHTPTLIQINGPAELDEVRKIVGLL